MGSIVGWSGVRAHVIIVLHEYIWSAPAVSVSLPNFDDTDSLHSPLRRVICPPGSTLSDYLSFPCEEYGG